MLFGICTSIDRWADVKAAGWDFVEENIQKLFQGQLPDDQWTGLARVKAAGLRVPAANCLLPGSLPVVGPQVDMPALRQYMTRVIARADMIGMKILVFGSGGARKVLDGFPMPAVRGQLIEFAGMAARLAEGTGVTLVAEPLNKSETNTMNSLAQAMDLVQAVNHPHFQCLADSFHFWLENDSLQDLEAAMPWIRHVHLADMEKRVAPGESGKSDYRPFFRVLKQAGYDRAMSIEPIGFTDIAGTGPRVLEFVKKQWNEA